MQEHKDLLLILGGMFIFSTGLTAKTVNEKLVLELAKNNAPQLNIIKSNELQNRLQQLKTEELFSTELYVDGQYIRTKENSLIPMNPTFSPIMEAKLGVRKNHEWGLSSDVSAYTNVKSSTSGATRYNDLSATTLQYTFKMDLWRDFLGRISKTNLKNVKDDNQKSKIQAEIAAKNFEIQLRKVYWTLVANNESLKVSNELLKSANNLLAESKRRFANSVAEKDEVARYEALVAQRRGSILLLEYQRENLLQTLKSSLPEIGNEVQISDYDISQTIAEVLQCTEIISGQSTTPKDFTKYDELATLLKELQTNQTTLNNRYDSPDLKLFGSVKSTGTSSSLSSNGSYNGSLSDSRSDLGTDRMGYVVGLNLVIPLGNEKNQTKTVKEEYDKLYLNAEIDKINSNIESTHSQLVRSIQVLNQVLQAQRINSEQLKIRIEGIRKKYMQARASADDIINDQDSLLASELTTIETRLKILNTIFDYFTIFTETKCEFNRI